MSIVLQSSGGGSITIAEPATASNFTQTLPAATGTVVISGTTPSLNGIAFPATQSASADANTLDDYEEGTWTPTFTFGGGSTGITYTDQFGLYTKVGRVVTVQCYIALSNKGSSTGNFALAGLPFTSFTTGNNYSACAVWANTLTGTSGGLVAFIAPNTNSVVVFQTTTGTSSRLTNSNFGNSSDMMINMTYVVA